MPDPEAEAVLAVLEPPCSCGTHFPYAPLYRSSAGRTWRFRYGLHEEGGPWCRLQAAARRNIASTQPPGPPRRRP